MEQTSFNTDDSLEYVIQFYDTSGSQSIVNGNGIKKTYFPGGKVQSIIEYKSGLKHGNYTLYKPNGQFRKQGFYKNGLMDSTWEEAFIVNSNTYQKRNYKAGLKDGEFIEYYPEGKINITGNYIGGLKNGDWTYYYINGKYDMKGSFMEDKQLT